MVRLPSHQRCAGANIASVLIHAGQSHRATTPSGTASEKAASGPGRGRCNELERFAVQGIAAGRQDAAAAGGGAAVPGRDVTAGVLDDRHQGRPVAGRTRRVVGKTQELLS